ncbi:unnamed protein product [Protopolystoma xenopodis]|uniref:Uncharacterized protein n=1 Tax=Protopolystoma xenopodis TaxID=117903 RepID=A0A3S5ASN9_9PLAT|nr:unnamed protein product [Protopolystoma xenopodis]
MPVAVINLKGKRKKEKKKKKRQKQSSAKSRSRHSRVSNGATSCSSSSTSTLNPSKRRNIGCVALTGKSARIEHLDSSDAEEDLELGDGDMVSLATPDSVNGTAAVELKPPVPNWSHRLAIRISAGSITTTTCSSHSSPTANSGPVSGLPGQTLGLTIVTGSSSTGPTNSAGRQPSGSANSSFSSPPVIHPIGLIGADSDREHEEHGSENDIDDDHDGVCGDEDDENDDLRATDISTSDDQLSTNPPPHLVPISAESSDASGLWPSRREGPMESTRAVTISNRHNSAQPSRRMDGRGCRDELPELLDARRGERLKHETKPADHEVV